MIFSYCCLDTWFVLWSNIQIFDADKDNILLQCLDSSEEIKKTLPYEAIQKISDIIEENDMIFSFTSDEISEAIAENLNSQRIIIMDGCFESICFSDTVHQANFSVNNIRYVKNSASEKLQLLLRVSNKIFSILSEYGIESKYFGL